MTAAQRKAAKWDAGLKCFLLPRAPSTLYDEHGQPIGRSWLDESTEERKFSWTEPSTSGSSTRGWDEDRRKWQEFTIGWDGAIPEEVRFGTPGHSRGLLLEFYPSVARSGRLDARLIPKAFGQVWRSFNKTENASLSILEETFDVMDELVPQYGGREYQLRWKTLEQLEAQDAESATCQSK